MTVEEIEMRKVVKEMLSDVGINRETLKQAVKDILEEKINKAIMASMHETAGGTTFAEKLENYARNYVNSWQFREAHRELVKDTIKEELQGFRINVEIKKEVEKS